MRGVEIGLLLVTVWRLFDGLSGRPGNGPATATNFTGSYVAGTMWQVTQPGLWFYGYWWWCCGSGQATAGVKCALWSAQTSTGQAYLVPGSVVTSGTLTPGTWNFIPLPTPIPVALVTPYVAAIAQNGSFPDTPSQFGSGQPYANGIVNGPLMAYSDSTGGGASNVSPYVLPQGCFTTAHSDPTAAMPTQGNSSSNLWADIEVSDVAPAGYGGPYRLWFNKGDASPTSGLDAALPFTLATQVNLSRACATSWVWYCSYPGAASLPTQAAIYSIGSQLLVAQNASPSWLTPDGLSAATAGAFWCKCALSTTLPAGQYKVVVYNANGAGGSWSVREYGYWLTGAGSSGVSFGPISSPSQGSAASAYVWQSGSGSTPPFTDGHTQQPQNGTFFEPPSGASTGYPYLGVVDGVSIGVPAGAVAEWFGVDLEVTPLPSSGLLMAGLV